MLNDRVIRLQLNFNTNEYKVLHLGEKKKHNHTYKIIGYRNREREEKDRRGLYRNCADKKDFQ